MADLPEVGSVWSFRTRPDNEFSPPETGRYAALKVIEVTPLLVAVVFLDGVWTAPPDLEQIACCGFLQRLFDEYNGETFVRVERPYHLATERNCWRLTIFDEPRLVGVFPLNAEEAGFAAVYRDRLMGGLYGGVEGLDAAAEAR